MVSPSLLDGMIEQKQIQHNEQLMQEIGTRNAAGATIRNPSSSGSSYASPFKGNAVNALTIAIPDWNDALWPYHDKVTNVHPPELALNLQSTEMIQEESAAQQTSRKPTKPNENASKAGLPPKPRKYVRKGTQQQTIGASKQRPLEDDHGSSRRLSGSPTGRGKKKSMTLKTANADTLRRRQKKKSVEELPLRSFDQLLSESLDRRENTISPLVSYGVYPGVPLLVEIHYSIREKWLLGFNQVVNHEGKSQSESILKEHFAKLEDAFLSVMATTIPNSPRQKINLRSCLYDAIFGTSKHKHSVMPLKNMVHHPVIGTFERPELLKTLPLNKPQRILLAFFSGELSDNPQEVAILLIGYFLQTDYPETWATEYLNNFETYLKSMTSLYPHVQLQLIQEWYKSSLPSPHLVPLFQPVQHLP